MDDMMISVRQMNVHYIYITYFRVTRTELVINDLAVTTSSSQYFPV